MELESTIVDVCVCVQHRHVGLPVRPGMEGCMELESTSVDVCVCSKDMWACQCDQAGRAAWSWRAPVLMCVCVCVQQRRVGLPVRPGMEGCVELESTGDEQCCAMRHGCGPHQHIHPDLHDDSLGSDSSLGAQSELSEDSTQVRGLLVCRCVVICGVIETAAWKVIGRGNMCAYTRTHSHTHTHHACSSLYL